MVHVGVQRWYKIITQGPLISQQPGYQTDFNQVLSPPQILLIFSPPLRRPHLGSADG